MTACQHSRPAGLRTLGALQSFPQLAYPTRERTPVSTVQPYPADTVWSFRSNASGHEFNKQLVLHAEPDGSSLSDDYLPEEITAEDLWAEWVRRYVEKYHAEAPDRYQRGQVPIYWTVTTPQMRGIFESAPFQQGWNDFPAEDFLTHYTVPRHTRTGETINWLRVPVLDRGWNSKRADKSGFIQEATGWKPSPLQAVMDVFQIGRVAGLYVP